MKLFYLPLLFIIAALGCSKKKDTITTKPTDTTKLVYTVNGLSDIIVPQYLDTTVYVVYNVKLESGIQAPVTVTPKNLPAGVTITPDSVSGTPTFAAQFTVHVLSLASGTFPIAIEVVTAAGAKTNYSFNLIVTPQAAFAYNVAIADVSNVFSSSAATVDVPVAVTYVAGTKETVMLVADGLPSGVTMTTATSSGKPDFTTTYVLHIPAGQAIGTYPVTVHASSATTGPKACSFSLKIVPSPDCAGDLNGIYSSTTTCTSYSGPETGVHPETVASGSTMNQLALYTPFSIVYAVNLNCATGTMVNAGGSTTVGTFVHHPTHDTLIFTYNPAGSGSCTTKYTR